MTLNTQPQSHLVAAEALRRIASLTPETAKGILLRPHLEAIETSQASVRAIDQMGPEETHLAALKCLVDEFAAKHCPE